MPRLVAAIHEIAELVRISKAASRRVIAGDLIAPRAVERMLGHGQQLDVRVAHVAHVGEQRVGQFAVAEKAIAFLDLALPRAEMHFVDAHRLAMPLLLAALLHPLVIAPRVALEIEDQRSRLPCRAGRKTRTDRSSRRCRPCDCLTSNL